MKTGYQATLMGFSIYFIPFLFFYKPGLLLYGSVPEVISAFFFSTLCVFSLSAAIQFYMIRKAKWYEIILLFLAAGLLVPNDLFFNIIGMALIGSEVLFQYLNQGPRQVAFRF